MKLILSYGILLMEVKYTTLIGSGHNCQVITLLMFFNSGIVLWGTYLQRKNNPKRGEIYISLKMFIMLNFIKRERNIYMYTYPS